jgi:hypothetical protein
MTQLESYHLLAFPVTSVGKPHGRGWGRGGEKHGNNLGKLHGDHREDDLYLAIIKPQIKNVKHLQTNEKSKV